jgi:hypothetical protein
VLIDPSLIPNPNPNLHHPTHSNQQAHPCNATPLTNLPSRKLNTSPSTVDDKDILKMHLVNPPVKKIDLHFPLGLEVTARNSKGVTIKDALDAIHKQFKKKVPTPSLFHYTLRPSYPSSLLIVATLATH